jgi:hypothetical protein
MHTGLQRLSLRQIPFVQKSSPQNVAGILDGSFGEEYPASNRSVPIGAHYQIKPSDGAIRQFQADTILLLGI